MVCHMGWADINLGHSSLPSPAWADGNMGNMAESVVQLGKMVEHLNQSPPNPRDRTPAPP